MATIGVKLGRFQFQGGTSQEWADTGLILLENELAYEADSNRFKMGDGKSKYKDLPYITVGNIEFDKLTDEQKESLKGDKGDPGPPGKNGSDATVIAGAGLTKTGSTLSVDNTIARVSDLPKWEVLSTEEEKAKPRVYGVLYFETE